MSHPFTAQAMAFAWISSLLSADATLLAAAPGGVHRDLAPPGTPSPYVIASIQSGNNKMTATAVRLWTDVLAQVKAVGPASSYAAIVAASARIDVLLNSSGIATVTGGYILSSYQESPLAVSEIVAGEQWNNDGGLYRIAIQMT